MALDIASKYPGKSNAPTEAYPFGSARNITTPGDGTGTPLEEAWLNDQFGFQQALLSASGLTPSGNADTAQVSQYLEAARIMLGAVAKSVVELEAITASVEGQRAFLSAGRRSGPFNATLSDISTQVAADQLQGVYVAFASDPTGASGGWVRSVTNGVLTPGMFGGVKDGADATPTDNTAALNALFAVAARSFSVLFDGMYATTGLNITRALNSGISIFGVKNPADKVVTNDTPGVSAYGAQASVLTIGEPTGTCEGGSIENFCVYGRDQNISLAAFVPERWSQGAMRNFLVTRAKGRLVLARKWEDMDVFNFRALYGGTPGGREGGLMFGESPDLQSNVLKFFGGRFEWIDGPMVGLATGLEADAAVSHATFIGTKFEVGEDAGYGTTRASNPVWDFRPSAFFRTQNVRFIDCWLSQADQCKEVLHLGDSHGVHVINLKMSTPGGGSVKTVTMDETGGTDARDFVWRKSSVINTSGNYASFTLESDINCINPVEYDRPTEYQTYGSRLSNNNPNILDANIIGVAGRMVQNPNNSADKSITSSGTVCCVSGSNQNTICNLSSPRYEQDNTQSGIGPDLYDSIMEFRVRAKKSGNIADANVELRAGGSFVSQIVIDSENFKWYRMFGNLRDFSGSLVLSNSTGNQADHAVYVDAVEVLQVDTFYASAIPTSGTYRAGERVRFNAPASGGTPGAVCVTSGNPGVWAGEALLQ